MLRIQWLSVCWSSLVSVRSPFQVTDCSVLERGQGMNHGIADATVLVKELAAAKTGSKSVQSAVDAYQNEMVARAGEEVALGVVNTEMLHDWSRFSQSPLMARGGDPNRPATK
jgi:hypothetical protein